jgi:DNA-binding MarR family transcriptional regulator
VTTHESGPMLSPGFWLYHATRTWRAELDARLRPLGLTPTQFMLLASAGWLEHLNGPPTQQQVADQAGVDRMMTSRVLRAMEGRGLLVRQSDTNTVRLHLTAAGRHAVEQASQAARDIDVQLFGTDSAAMRATLRGIAEHRKPPKPGG